MERMDSAEASLGLNDVNGVNNHDEDCNIHDQVEINTINIKELNLDIDDVSQCLQRQRIEHLRDRSVLELYCHQHAYVEWIMDECKPILVENTRLPYGIDFSLNTNDYESP